MSFVKSQEEKKVQFKGETKDQYLADVRKRVEEYFAFTKKSKSANWVLHLKGLGLFFSCALIYCTLLNGWLPAIPRAFFWIAFGVNQAFISVNIGHDSLHGSYTQFPLVNKLLGYLSYDCIGLSSHVWKQTHNQEHHTYTNISGMDPDINKPGLLRLSPHDPHYKIHRYQHCYIWLLYALVGLNWILYTDYVEMWNNRKKVPKSEWFPFFFFKAVNLGVIVVAPLLWSPMAWWEIFVGYILLQFAGGFTVAIIFQLAHVVENVDFPLPNEEGIIPMSWGAHEMATTSNFATHSPFVTHVVGGLNFQIEHHLFPKISHCHYPAVSKIVRKTAKEYNLPYHEQPTMISAIASHTRLLKKLGRGAEFKSISVVE